MHHATTLPAVAIAMVMLASILRPLVRLFAGASGPPPPVAKPFLTPRETAMLGAIERVLPAHRVHAQVAMGALLQVPTRPGRAVTPADRNSFSQKIVDFVIQERATGRIVALIEVDDRSHEAWRDQARDAMTARAGYRTIRIAGSARPTLADVRQALAPIFYTMKPTPGEVGKPRSLDQTAVARRGTPGQQPGERSGGGGGTR